MQQAKPNMLSFLLYLLGFLLFWEWLRPLSVITDTENLGLFVSFAAFSFFLSYLQFPIWLTFPVKTIAVLYAVHVLFFFNSSLFDSLWIKYLYRAMKINIIFLFNGNWDGLSNLFRSILFFILLWIVSYLMHYWLIQTRKLFLFFFVTVIYLAVLDTFTMYHADMAIVRTMVIGFVLLGLLRVIKVQEKEKVSFDKGRLPLQWIMALIFMITFTSVIGYAAPKVGPQWPDPVPFITKAQNGYGNIDGTGNGSGGTVQTIGYDSNDTHLGGPFINDNSVVFTAYTKDIHYWRIETKDDYTGKGWINKDNQGSVNANANDLSQYPALQLYGPDTNTTEDKATIKMDTSTFPQLLYGGELEKIEGTNANLSLNKSTGKIEPMQAGRHITVPSYTMTYKYPTFNVSKLQKTFNNDPQAIKDRFLQLPKTLPVRIKQLAENITQNKTNRYDKAEAIVNYFKGNNYTYDTKNVAVPKGNQDYVDQFLFDTKRGYCDNFSSSMVVMLRSIGIPARWVKGFTQGSYQDTLNNGQSVFVVKNSNAHSWVEVYFPNSGWVPFEPTISFTNVANFNYQTDSSKTSPVTAKPSKPKTPKQPLKGDKNSGSVHLSFLTKLANLLFSRIGFYMLMGILLILAVIGLLMFKYRRKWLPKYILYTFRNRDDERAFDDALKRLIWLLGLFGYYSKLGQTMREFAVTVDRQLGTSSMKKLILNYEKDRYAPHSNQSHWLESKELWENIIKSLEG